jgi:hypothetical protein
MPLPRGSDPAKAIFGYINALNGLPAEAIENGIRRFLRGECDEVSRKFCPHPPELAAICRDSMPTPRTATFGTGKLYGYYPPNSDIVERSCTKEYARSLVDRGFRQRGCIWCPGGINDRPDIGDLYGPDPDWKGPWPLDRADQEHARPKPYEA